MASSNNSTLMKSNKGRRRRRRKLIELHTSLHANNPALFYTPELTSTHIENTTCHCASNSTSTSTRTDRNTNTSTNSRHSPAIWRNDCFAFGHYRQLSIFGWKWLAITAYRILAISLLIGILCPSLVWCVDPKFDPSTRMRLVLVPSDAQVGSVIYRLRATDEEFDYPLTFELIGEASSATIKIESLPCTKYNSVCQANVILQRRLEPGRYYDFQVSVKDTKGGMATQSCSITATNFTTPHDLIFPHKPSIIMIPEVNQLII